MVTVVYQWQQGRNGVIDLKNCRKIICVLVYRKQCSTCKALISGEVPGACSGPIGCPFCTRQWRRFYNQCQIVDKLVVRENKKRLKYPVATLVLVSYYCDIPEREDMSCVNHRSPLKQPCIWYLATIKDISNLYMIDGVEWFRKWRKSVNNITW